MKAPDVRGGCPHCNLPTRFEAATHFYFEKAGGASSEPGSIRRSQEPVVEKSLPFAARACAHCGGIVLWIVPEGQNLTADWIKIYPKTSRVAPAEVRSKAPEVAQDYEEAASIADLSPKASATLSRRALQAILIEEGAATPNTSLSTQIDEVLPSLPAYLAKDVDAIRNHGNFAAHPLKDKTTGQIVDVEPGEALWNLEVIEALFDFYYVGPVEAQRRREKLNAKLKAAGKPPMK